MALQIGDRVEYKSEPINGEPLKGEIVVVEKNSRDFITNYFVWLDEGTYVQFKPLNLYWHKLDE